MTAFFLSSLLAFSTVSQASQSWVCTCIDQQGKNLGGIAFDIKLTRDQAEYKAFGSCLMEAPATHSIRCEKFDDGRPD